MANYYVLTKSLSDKISRTTYLTKVNFVKIDQDNE